MCFVTQYRSQSTGDDKSKGGKKKDSKMDVNITYHTCWFEKRTYLVKIEFSILISFSYTFVFFQKFFFLRCK
jgi:hypothetical protein